MLNPSEQKGTVIGSIILHINDKGRVSHVEITGNGDLCTRATLNHSTSLISNAVLRHRSRRKKSALEAKKEKRILSNKVQKKSKKEIIPPTLIKTNKENKK